jgi:DNA polymerase sigma
MAAGKRPFEHKNTASVAELFLGFFQYYSAFDVDVDCVDTIAGHLIPKRSTATAVRRSALCVLDPTDSNNNVARCTRRWEWQTMHKEFIRARDLLKAKHALGQQCFEELTELVDTTEQQVTHPTPTPFFNLRLNPPNHTIS